MAAWKTRRRLVRWPRSSIDSTAWRSVSGPSPKLVWTVPTTATLPRTWLILNDYEGSTRRTALGEVARLLDGLAIRWALIGGLAANRYRRTTRYTVDVDLLLAGGGSGLDAVETALVSSGWSVRRGDAEGTLLRASHREFGPVDLLIAGTDYQQEALHRARVETLEDVGAVPVLAVEDVIVHKLIAGRYQDLADIEAILDAEISFDRSYVERWAEFWEVLDRWRAFER